MANTEQQSTGNLLTDALTHVSSLVRKEMNLAKAEMSENFNSAIGALITLAVALVFAIVALNTLSAALVGWIAAAFGMNAGWASLIVAVVMGAIALICLSTARSKLKARSLAPTQTVKNVRRDVSAVKEVSK